MNNLEYENLKEAEKYFAYTSPLSNIIHHLHEAKMFRKAYRVQRILIALGKTHGEISEILSRPR